MSNLDHSNEQDDQASINAGQESFAADGEATNNGNASPANTSAPNSEASNLSGNGSQASVSSSPDPVLSLSPVATASALTASADAQVAANAANSSFEYYVSNDGDDANLGTIDAPFETIQHAITKVAAGDVVNIRGGIYREKLLLEDIHGTADNRITFKGYQGEDVLITGAKEITTPWEIHEGNIWKTTVDFDVSQLFLDDKMLTGARWPNITKDWDQPDDSNGYDPTADSYWDLNARAEINANPDKTGEYINLEAKHSLADLDFSVEGAMLIPHKWLAPKFTPGGGQILSHNAGEGTFELDKSFELYLRSKSPYFPLEEEELELDWSDGDLWGKHTGIKYYLTGQLELLDSPREWFFDVDSSELYAWLDDNKDPNDSYIQARTHDKGTYDINNDILEIKDSSFLDFKGITLHTGSFTLEEVKETSFEDSKFLYSTSEGHMLKSGDSPYYSNYAKTTGIANLSWESCEFAYSYTPFLTLNKGGSGFLINNSYFHNNARGSGVVDNSRAQDYTMSRSTVHTIGYGGLFGPRGAVFDNNHIYGFHFSGDNSAIQFPAGNSREAIVKNNWIHDAAGRNGIRFDGDPGGTDGTIHNNVVFDNRRGLRIKGDQHTILNNTLFNNSRYDLGVSYDKFYGYDPEDSREHEDRIKGTRGVDPYRGNFNSIVHNNAGNNNLKRTPTNSTFVLNEDDNTANLSRKDRGTYLEDELRDPTNYDFRPREHSVLIDAGTVLAGYTDEYVGAKPDIGAYEYGDLNYWIPGHQIDKAKTPVPFDSSGTVKTDADLMWLEGKDSIANNVYLGTDKSNLVFQGSQANNIFDPGTLIGGQQYYWRIDTVTDDDVIEGDLWDFTPVSGQEIIIPTVEVADEANVADSSEYGAVPYSYYIGKYEITNREYAAFLNSVAATDTHNLYNPEMSDKGGISRDGKKGLFTYSTIDGHENDPVTFVNFWDAARFTNWLTSGDTENGVYQLDATGIENNSITRDISSWEEGGVAIANEDEWYKAAYYSGEDTGADGDGYWLYPTQSDTISIDDANYGDSKEGVIPVGSFADNPSYYGTFDQAGNAREWIESIPTSTSRGWRGGSFTNNESTTRSSNQGSIGDNVQYNNTGFRVTSLAPIGNGFSAIENQQPAWQADKWSTGEAVVEKDYSFSILDNAVDPESEILSFKLLDGPEWLSLETDGNLTGSPTAEDLGINYALFRVTDPHGLYADTPYPVRLEVLHPNAPTVEGIAESQVVSIVEETQLDVVDASADQEVGWSLLGVDQSLFEVTDDGLVSFLYLPDYESPTDLDEDNQYEISLSAKNAQGYEKIVNFIVNVLDDNVNPTNLDLSSLTFDENIIAGTSVATLQTVDPNVGDTHTYDFAAGNGDSDNIKFTIDGNRLLINEKPNFEAKDVYNINLQTTDSLGLSFEKSFELSVGDLNDSPTDIALSVSSFDENIEAGTSVATLSSIDPDANDSHNYSFAVGEGNIDNTFFSIDGDQLKINISPDYESKETFNIRLKTTDIGGLAYEESFALTTNDLQEVVIDSVQVIESGNASDSTGFGAVAYDYHIGKYEVSNSDYSVFLNNVASVDDYDLYYSKMSTIGGILRTKSDSKFTYSPIEGKENDPVTFVNFWDAARFTNWLTSGDTENGVYQLDAAGIENNSITRDISSWEEGGVAIANEDEWYKAAYYSGDPTGVDGNGYWLYPTQSNTISIDDANYDDSEEGVIPVGSYNKPSHYGTFDQAGNAKEWTEGVENETRRIHRGGAFNNNELVPLASKSGSQSAASHTTSTGFRVTSLELIGNGRNYIENYQPFWQEGYSKGLDAVIGDAYSFSIKESAIDPEGDQLSFSMLEAPEWLSLDSQGNLSGTPSQSDIGINYATFRVADTSGLYHDTPLPVEIEVNIGAEERLYPYIANSWAANKARTEFSDIELGYSLHLKEGTEADQATARKQLAVLGDSVDLSDTYRLDITAKSLAAGYNLETADITINFDPYLFDEIKASDITIGGQLPIANAVQIDNVEGTIRIAAASLGDLEAGDLYGNHLTDAGASIGTDGAVLASIDLDFNELNLAELKKNLDGSIDDLSTPLFFGLSANQDETVFSTALDDESGFANREIKSLRELGGDLAVDGTKVTLYEAEINLKEQGDGLILSSDLDIGSYHSSKTNLLRKGDTITATSEWTNVGNIKATDIAITGVANDNASLSSSSFYISTTEGEGYQALTNLESGSFSSTTGAFDSTGQETAQLVADIEITGAAGNVVDLSAGILSLKAEGSDVFENKLGSKNLITYQGDLNYDGRVSMKDLAYLNAGAARQQLVSEGQAAADANNDGFVDASVARGVDANFDGQISMADLAVLDADWGKSLHQVPQASTDAFLGESEISWEQLESQGTTGDTTWDNQAFKDQNALEADNDFVESLESPAAVGVIDADGDSSRTDNDIAGDYFQDPLNG
ncbi:SUMF1/EgtB/PvdO family nonheme iron enzyme [Prochlorococcus sp. MIT 0714]|uniref:SUMF1/EgtB/PvdO family nonheme iron enzyme n=1 Tax=Prochlorococcus sp. MIT 0714 TaxID=3082540 RepID=UPI0039B04285